MSMPPCFEKEKKKNKERRTGAIPMWKLLFLSPIRPHPFDFGLSKGMVFAGRLGPWLVD